MYYADITQHASIICSHYYVSWAFYKHGLTSQHGLVIITSIIKCGVKLIINSQISMFLTVEICEICEWERISENELNFFSDWLEIVASGQLTT